MFEQSLYDQEPIREPHSEAIAPPVQEGDLFGAYEVKSWSLSPRLYKILGASAAVNLLALLVFAQTSVLTMKGCDSPLVGSVCQVLDTVYIGAMLFGTEREYIDADYEKTDLGDATIVYTELPPESEKLYYPADYFQIANPIEYQAMLDQQNGIGLDPGYLAPGIPGNPAGFPPMNTPYKPGKSIFDTPARTPKRNNNVTDLSQLPSGIDDVNDADPNPIAKGKKPKGGDGSIASTTNPDGSPKGFPDGLKPKADPTAPVTKVTINREPLSVFGRDVALKLDNKEIDITKNFTVTAQATLLPDGRFDTSIDKKTKLKKSRVLTGEGDPEMIKVVTEAIAAVGDSGWLGYLSIEGIKKINFTFTQNDEQLFVSVTSEELTPERAATMSGKLNGAIQVAIFGDKSGLKTLGDDEKALLASAQSKPDGKLVVLSFTLPKQAAQEMINRNIQKAKESEAKKAKDKEGQLIGAQPGDRVSKK